MFVVNFGQVQRQNVWTDAQEDYHRLQRTHWHYFFFPFSFFKNKRMERQMREWIAKMQVYNLIPNLINKKFTAHCFIFADTNFLWHSETGRAFYNNAENIKKKWYCLGLLFFEEMKYSRNILIVYFWKYS